MTAGPGRIEAGDDGFDPPNSTNYYSGLIEEVTPHFLSL